MLLLRTIETDAAARAAGLTTEAGRVLFQAIDSALGQSPGMIEELAERIAGTVARGMKTGEPLRVPISITLNVEPSAGRAFSSCKVGFSERITVTSETIEIDATPDMFEASTDAEGNPAPENLPPVTFDEAPA